MNEIYVAVRGKKAAATLLRVFAGASDWNGTFVMPLSTWKVVVETYAYAVLTPAQQKGWREMEFAGETEFGVWLKDVNVAEVTRYRYPFRRVSGSAFFVSRPIYDEMRSKYFPWWQKTQEQAGWNLVAPSNILWHKAGEPYPEEMATYQAALKSSDFDSDEKQALVTKMAVRCDPSMKLYKLAMSKRAAKTKK